MHISDVDAVGGLTGGLLIGAAATAMLYLTGKITGISGITHTMVTASHWQTLMGWRTAYILGLVTCGVLFRELQLDVFSPTSTLRPSMLAFAGLLVGFGTRLGSGCTSGHGVCGLPRFSARSLVAVLTFMTAGMITAGAVQSQLLHQLFHANESLAFIDSKLPSEASWLPIAAMAALAGLGLAIRHLFFHAQSPRHPHAQPAHSQAHVHSGEHLSEIVVAFLLAMVFGAGLAVAGMTNADKVVRFLDLLGTKGWDPTLMFVMGGAVIFNVLSFQWLRGLAVPLLDKSRSFDRILHFGNVPENVRIDWHLLAGSAMFGIGWGIAGFCPGPALVSFGALQPAALIFVPFMLFGMIAYSIVFKV